MVAQSSGRMAVVTDAKYDQSWWEQLWSKTVREHEAQVSSRPPNARLIAEVSGMPPGRALDAGCGHGAETLWLAAHGWQVTGVDFSPTALAHGRKLAESLGADIAERINWIEDDLATWTAPARCYELVLSFYVHIATSIEDLVGRMADAVAPGGTLFMIGHRPVDPETGAATRAAGQTQVSVDDVVTALDSEQWEFVIAEERPRAVAGTGVDAVILARRVS